MYVPTGARHNRVLRANRAETNPRTSTGARTPTRSGNPVRATRRRSLALLPMVLLALLSGCTVVRSTPAPDPGVVRHAVAPSFVFGTDSSAVDELAATVVTDAQDYWEGEFRRLFGRDWHDLDGGFFSVDTTDENATPPPCSADVTELTGNAYYCAAVDAIAWDRAAMLPVLRDHYGQSAVVLVLAHEIGHAVAHRLGHEPASGERSPLRIETTADCYAGSYVRWVVDGDSRRLRMDSAELDAALRALINFADPVTRSGTDAHGTAYERTGAFQDGYTNGPRTCATEHELSGEWSAGGGSRGNRDVTELLRERVPAARDFFGRLVERRGGRWNPPRVLASEVAGCEGPAILTDCGGNVLAVNRERLRRSIYELGDQAAETPLIGAFATAAARGTASGTPERRGLRAACLTGAYTGHLVRDTDRAAGSDLNEAIRAVLAGDAARREVFGASTASGFEELRAFRGGVSGTAKSCS
ncbi:neutral zinc metallopeptidase [Actinopolyspora sp. H202]|uniref:neutral zinc metallopeptidase n=1 Tax=Actinopolyspora sp. H202 TaxID=1500456 RepID=UPI003EE5E8C3